MGPWRAETKCAPLTVVVMPCAIATVQSEAPNWCFSNRKSGLAILRKRGVWRRFHVSIFFSEAGLCNRIRYGAGCLISCQNGFVMYICGPAIHSCHTAQGRRNRFNPFKRGRERASLASANTFFSDSGTLIGVEKEIRR